MVAGQTPVDAVVIGGGFYGATIAAYLVRSRGLQRVVLVEREARLLSRASFNNQARVHNGYHYPRSFTTAYRSRVNLPRFVDDFPQVVKRDFTKLYAITRKNSKVASRQFERFCREIGARIEMPPPALLKFFDPMLIDSVFLVEEYAFDASRLAQVCLQALQEQQVALRLGTRALGITRAGDELLAVQCRDSGGEMETLECRYVFNCTYSGINHLHGQFEGVATKIKQEITEMALVDMPPALKDIGVTVMDGPFFSAMPFPAKGLHTVSHVRYTPHLAWEDERDGVDPYEKLDAYDRQSRYDRMIRDISRYMPAMSAARYVESLFEVKTILVKSEADDGRPILFEKSAKLPGCYSILGGKIDNVYDALEKLDHEPIVARTALP